MKARKINWLDRRVAYPGPCLTLCTSEEQFLAVVKRLKVRCSSNWVGQSSNAAMHYFDNTSGGPDVAVVCIDAAEIASPITVAAMLVHEAVHVWQRYAESIGEHKPGDEQEAYAIQSISTELMTAYAKEKFSGQDA